MSEAPALPGRGIKPLASLLAHPRLAVAAALLVLAVGVPMAWKKGTPRWQAEATVQVQPRYMRNLRDDPELEFQSNTQYRQYVEQMRRSIARPDIVEAALDGLGEQRALWQRPGESDQRAVQRLRERLVVASVPDTYLIRVALEGAEPGPLAPVVNAVTATFVETMRDELVFGADGRVERLRQRERELLAVIDQKDGTRARIAQELALTTFHEGTPNPYDALVAGTRGRLAEARQRRLDAAAALDAFDARGDTNVVTRSVQDTVLNDPGLNSLKGALASRRAALLVQISGLRADHPGRVAAERELGEIEAELRGQGDRLESGVRRNLRARLESSLAQAAAVERGLQVELTSLEGRASDFARLFQQASGLTADIQQARSELEKVRERVNALAVESQSPGFVRLVTPAVEPELPFGPGRRKLLMMTLLAAFGAALVVPILRDLLDRRVRTVNDAEKLMGMPPAGWQVARTDVASQVFAEDQRRRIAAALIRRRDASARGVFGFTGLKPGAGASTLVLEVAATLQALGFRVLAVEANGFARDSRFGDGPGLHEMLRGEREAADLVADAVPGQPARVPVGGRGRVAVERLDRLGDALGQWAREFDFVLVDLPPLLASADAELMLRTVGQVMLVIEAEGVTRGEVLRGRRLLQAVDPDAVGHVVNRVHPFTGGYLHELMLEAISGRRPGTVFTTPHWRLLWQALRTRRAGPRTLLPRS